MTDETSPIVDNAALANPPAKSLQPPGKATNKIPTARRHDIDGALNKIMVMLQALSVLIMALAGTSTLAAEQPKPRPILSAAEIDYPPFSVVDDHGRATGFAVELLRASLAAMGRDATFRTGVWSEVRGWLEQGEVEVLPLVGRTPQRERLFDFTVPYMSLHGAIVVRAGTEGIESLNDLRGRTVAVMRGDNAEEFLRREDRGFTIQTTATFEQALRELSEGRHDAVVIQRLVALRLIRDADLANLRILDRPIEGFRQDFCFAVREGNRDLLSLLNEGLALIVADGTHRMLHARWFGHLALPYNRRLIVEGNDQYPPFSFLDTQGQPTGYTVELTRALAHALDLDMQIGLAPWTVVRERLKQGEIDAIQGMLYSPERDNEFDFSVPLTTIHYVAVVRHDDEPPRTLADLAGKRIVVQQADIMHDYVLENGLEKQTVIRESSRIILQELAEGRHDVALIARLSASYWIGQDGWDNLRIGQNSMLSADFCLAVPQGQGALLAQFNEGLQILKSNGRFREIHDKWMGFHEAPPLGMLEIIRGIAFVLVPLVVLLLMVTLWSWTLRRRVRAKTRELRESEEKYRSFFENSLDAILLTEPSGSIHAANAAACEMFGLDEAEICRRGRERLTDSTDPDQARLIEKRAQHGRARGELIMVRGDGSRFMAEVSSAIFQGKSGRMKATVIIRDITSRKHYEANLLQAKEQAEAANKTKSQFLANMSHEIRTPINGILGMMQLLESTPLSEEQAHYTGLAIHSAKRLTRLLSDILDLSMIDAGTMTIVKAPFQPRELGQSVVELFSILAREKGLDLELAVDPDIPEILVGDEARSRQILFNLVGNALKFTDAGSVRLEMWALAPNKSDAHRVLFVIEDTGIGIPEGKIREMFKPFVQADGSMTRPYQGAGLGLSIVHRLVGLMHGDIFLDSMPGEGTTIGVVLPFTLPASQIRDAATSGQEIPSGPGLRILLAEDDACNQLATSKILEQAGHTVTTVQNGQEAIARLTEQDFDCILMDIQMPVMTGDEATRAIRSSRDLGDKKNIPIIALTAHAMRGDRETFLAAGMDGYLTKPVTKAELAAVIRKFHPQNHM